MPMRRHWTAFVPILLIVLLAGPAQAQTPVLDRAAQELRRDPVYVDPAAERAGDVSEDGLRDRIRRGDRPVFVAVLPGAARSEAGGDLRQLTRTLMDKVGVRGTYAVLVGDSFGATSNSIPAGQAGEIATSTFQQRRDDGPNAVLEAFVERVNQVRSGSASPAGDSAPARDGGGGGGAVFLLLALLGGGLFLWSRSRGRQRREEQRKEFEGDRQMLQAELSVLASDVMELEPHVIIHPQARPDYDAGVTRYRSAQAALEYADDQVDLVRVERVIEEGRYAMDRARARVEGREPPRPPESLTRPGRHEEPALGLDERGEPVYVGYGGPWYGGGGWFGGGGGLLTGLMLGNILGGGWGGWGGWGHDHGHGGDDGGGGDWVGGGDWGGGDWGGGDFGGGDFGGGDFEPASPSFRSAPLGRVSRVLRATGRAGSPRALPLVRRPRCRLRRCQQPAAEPPQWCQSRG